MDGLERGQILHPKPMQKKQWKKGQAQKILTFYSFLTYFLFVFSCWIYSIYIQSIYVYILIYFIYTHKFTLAAF